MRVAVLDDCQQVAESYADWQSLNAEVVFHSGHHADDDSVIEALTGFDVVVAMRERTPFTAARLARLPDLRLLVTTGMKNASVDLAAARARGVTVCGTESTVTATPELTWGLILSLLRHIPEEDAGMRSGGWQRTVGADLAGRRLGVVGLGRLGRRVARIGQAFDMDVVAWSQNLSPAVVEDLGLRALSKEELFSTADVITVHYKLGERSRGIVGRPELALMKPTAYLVNTSRGPLIDTDALVEALQEGRIAGAALDVYDDEPLPADHPLRTTPRTVLTPHLGYVTEATYGIFYGQAVEDIAAWAAGEPVRVLS